MKTRPIATVFGLLTAVALTAGAQTVEIWEIQGDGMSSPLEGQRVTTRNNVVTAVGDEVFFIQTPDSRTDANPWTSDGVVVYGSSTTVSVGDLVDVTGTVEEFFGQTEISGDPSVTVISSDNPRPTSVTFDRHTPTPLQPWPETELERFEAMWLEVNSGLVSTPTDRFGEACVSSGGSRLFREPGILWPGLPGLAVWDGNPEAFLLDPYGLGGDGFDVVGGTRFSAEGVLAFSFDTYQMWPVTYDSVSVPQLPRPVPSAAIREITVATQNVWRLGDPESRVPLPTRLAKLSLHLRQVLRASHIVALQEVNDLETLERLADRIAADDPAIRYDAQLIEGNDQGGIDVGYLVRDPVEVESVQQIGADVRFTWDGTLLFDRPPLVLEVVLVAEGGEVPLTLVNVHLRSLNDIDDPDDGERVRRKRSEQSLWLSQWIQDRQEANASEALVVLGDFNAFPFSDGYVDVVGQVDGRPDSDGALLPATSVVDPALVNWTTRLPRGERYSFAYGCSAQALDHILTNRRTTPWVTRVAFARGNVDASSDLESDETTALRSSDHDGVVIYLDPGQTSRHRLLVDRRPGPATTARPVSR